MQKKPPGTIGFLKLFLGESLQLSLFSFPLQQYSFEDFFVQHVSVRKKLFGPLGAGAGALVLAIASTGSYLLGWLRDAIFVRSFGTTAFTDSYFKAFLLPDTLLTIFITGALLSLVIPLYTKAQKVSQEEGERAFGTFFTVLNTLYLIASGILFVLLPSLLTILFPETPLDQREILLSLSRILLGSNLLFAFSNFIGSFLLSHKRFLSYSLAPLLYNIGIILFIVFFGKEIGVFAAAWGALFGALFHLLLRIFDFYASSHRFQFSFDIHNQYFRELFWNMWPKVIALVSLQIGFYVFARLGDGILGAGNYSAFQYARNLQSFAVSLFGISLATAVFPFLSDFIAEKNTAKFVRRLEKSTRQILFLALPAAAGMVLLAPAIVRLVYGLQERSDLTIAVLIPLALSIPFESINHLLVRGFHVLGDTLYPMISRILFLILLIASSVMLIQSSSWGVASFGIAYTIAFVVQTIFLFIFLPQLSGPFPWKHFWKRFSKTCILTLGMILGVLTVQMGVQDMHFMLRIFLPAFTGALLFLGGAYLWRCEEIHHLPFWSEKKH